MLKTLLGIWGDFFTLKTSIQSLLYLYSENFVLFKIRYKLFLRKDDIPKICAPDFLYVNWEEYNSHEFRTQIILVECFIMYAKYCVL